MIGDIINFRGPLTGIFSALLSTEAPEVFVVARDMPFISDDMINLIKDSYKGRDAVIPVFSGAPQPLLGIYSNKVNDLLEERINFKGRAMRDLLCDIYVYYIPEKEILTVDPGGKVFH